MTQAGLFTPEDARMVLDAARFVRDNGFALRAMLKRDPLGMPDPAFPPIKFRNDSGEACPAYACMEVTGTATVGDRTVFTITKPTTDWGKAWLFNLHREVADGEYGIADSGVELFALTDASSASAGTRFSPQNGAWSLKENVAGPLVNCGSEDTIGSGAARFLVQPTGAIVKVFVAPSGGIPAASGGTYGNAVCTMRRLVADGIGNVSATNETDASASAVTQTVHNMGGEAVQPDATIQAVYIDGKWIANWEEC